MAARPKTHPDFPSLRRSRGGYNGAITKAADKLSEMSTMEPSSVNPKTVETLLNSIKSTEARYLNTLEEAQTFLAREDEAEDLLDEEEFVVELFHSTVAEARLVAASLLNLKTVSTMLRDLATDIKALRNAFSANPAADATDAITTLKTDHANARGKWNEGCHSEEHPLQDTLDRCGSLIAELALEMAHTRDTIPAAPHDTSVSSDGSGSTLRLRPPKLPTLGLPTFNGEVMAWASFWTAFSNQVGSREEISESDKLIYLRKAIIHQPTRDLLDAPREEEDSYAEVVRELKRRFDLPKEVHKTLVQRIINLTLIRDTQEEIMGLMDAVRKALLSLKRTGSYCLESFMTSVVYLILPRKLQVLWEQHTKKDKKVIDVFTMLDFFTEHAGTLTPASLRQSHQASKSDPSDKRSRHPGTRKVDTQTQKQKTYVHVNSTAAATSYKWDCPICPGDKHPLYKCPKWLGYSVTQRLEHVRNHTLCHNCLATGHVTASCRSSNRCRDCQQPHHSSIHQASVPPPTQINHSSEVQARKPDALMMTAQVTLTGPGGHTMPARALMDSGAAMSLVSSRIAQLLKLNLHRANIQFSGVQGTPCKAAKYTSNLSISPIQAKAPSIELAAAVVATVTNDLPAQELSSTTDLSHIANLQLADPNFHIPGRIDIILGADVYYRLLGKAPAVVGSILDPAAISTIFGWAITGPVRTHSHHTQSTPSLHYQLTPADLQLDLRMAQFWEMEEVDKAPEPLTSAEDQAQVHYDVTTSYSSDQLRYTVELPKKVDVPALGESRSQALSRYISNEKSIIRRKVWKPFQAVVQGYLDLGHAEPVPPSLSLPREHYYLPMHSVTKQSSTTTKLRVVFDGSATTSTGISLNESLLIGPTLHPTLGAILIKFRSYPVAITADISKMYREVALAPKDRDLHRFIWRARPEDPVKDYRMTRVTFGVSASPYLAVRTLQQAAIDHGEGYPTAVTHILESFYVDDLLAGADSPGEAISLHHQLRGILAKGGFDLCKWRSNSKNVLSVIPSELQESVPVKEMAESHTTPYPKALGLEWDSRLDLMAPAIQPSEPFNTTKRGLVSDVSKTFDILGWIAPAVLVMKLLYQQLWLLKTGWDEQLPIELIQQHSKWRQQLPVLSSKQLPRCYYHLTQPTLTRQLHGFADASVKAYGAVIYVRSTYAEHPPIISLIISKTRVAKLKPSTIPRQELCAAVLLTELLTEAKGILEIADADVHCWSDSSIVLSWLDGHPRDYKVFVTNRINSILQVTSPQSWRHVPTADNPADCASRGLMPSELLTHTLWWDGPEWLRQEPFSIPWQPPRKPLLAPELRVSTVINSLSQSPPPLLETRYSSYHKLVTITAWCLRFHAKLKRKKDTPHSEHLTVKELHYAEQTLARRSQERSFAKERQALLHDRALSPSSRLLALAPYLDQDLLLRVGGRLSNSSLTLSQMHPVIIDASDMFTKLLCICLHTILGHCGPTLLLASLGRRFHIVNARRLTRSICSQCTVCRKASPRPRPQQLGELPADRVSTTPAFQSTGVDYAGPFTLKKGHTRKPVLIKAYLALFVCLSTKAVHIEVVSDLTTAAFIATLQRFIARRGCPTSIHSDNGSNFIGARNQLAQLYQFLQADSINSSIHQHLLAQRIVWDTIPERSPHFGGLWESAVKKAKYHLKRVVGSQVLTYEELATVSAQVEACINSRPLTAMTSHNQDGITPLTPGHFLLLKPPTAYPEYPSLPEEPCNLKKWQLCKSMVQHFWERWSREYLQTLQARTKWKTSTPNLLVGDIVILKEDKTFACHWPLARVTKTYPGKDGLVRVAQITTGNSTYKRPITKLALLHREESQETSLTSLPPAICSGIRHNTAGN